MLQGVPLLYVPLEIIMSKYYGESERLLGKVFSLANDLPDGAIVFLDEVILEDCNDIILLFNFPKTVKIIFPQIHYPCINFFCDESGVRVSFRAPRLILWDTFHFLLVTCTK